MTHGIKYLHSLMAMTFMLFQVSLGCQYYAKRHWNAVLPNASHDFRIVAYQNTERGIDYPFLGLGIVILDTLHCDRIEVSNFEGKAKFSFSDNNSIEVPLNVEIPKLYSRSPAKETQDKSPAYFFTVWGGSHDFEKTTYGYCAARLSYPRDPQILRKPIKEIYYHVSLSIVLPSTEIVEVASEGKMVQGDKWCGKCKNW